MISDIEREKQNRYMQLSWNVLKFLLCNNSPESEKYKILTEELFDCFSCMLNLGSINNPNLFVLSLSYENNNNEREISFSDVDIYWREFPTEKQLLIDALKPGKKRYWI